MTEEGRRKYTERQRTSQACKKCRSLKRKCTGDRPRCRNCVGYGFECEYSDTYRGKRIKLDEPKIPDALGTDLPGLGELLKSLRHATRDPSQIDHYLALIEDASTPRGDDSTTEEAPPPHDAPPLRLQGVGDQSSDIAFARLVSRSKIDVNNVDEEIAKPSFQTIDELFRYPPREEAEKLLDAYFSTIHTAYPFISERWVRSTLAQVYDGYVPWADVERTALSRLNFLFSIGAYYCNWPYDDHCMYFARGRQLLFDVFKNASLDLAQAYMLGSCYLMIINKPARAWNLLGLVIRSCQNLGIPTDSEFATLTPVEREMNRRLWYAAYVLEHLLALQMGRQPCGMRDEEFHVPPPSQISDRRFQDDGTISPHPHPNDSFMQYVPPLIRFSRIIGIVQRELFYVNRPPMRWDATMKLIASIDNMIVEWKATLPASLNFDSATPPQHPIIQRQRNFFEMKYHNLRSVIHRPHITLAIMRQGKPQTNSREQDICLEEARQLVAMVDQVDSERSLHWNFPLWQLIPCLMSAATILVVGQKLVSDKTRQAQLAACVTDVLGVFDSLEKNTSAGRCAELIRSLQRLELKDIAPPAKQAAVAPRLPSHSCSPSSTTEQPYDQNFALDIDYLMQLDFGKEHATQFDWGETDVWTSS